ncbi:hypothetical protein Clacol_007235 [Clathrus columnatus]|uniref:Carboxymethylenebutenolidase n=1 Tax=Clathrus columnatus TaxID=1419009 RepID=A0AAV5AJW7_9AGAM|nr:hypothetical protein Clacol_007235 [Clathrus columnatus]
MPPTKYDPNSELEQPVTLPSAPQILLQSKSKIILQPPLSRRGHGPGLIVFLPDFQNTSLDEFKLTSKKLLDPEPVQKWAEEGFAVVGIYENQEQNIQDTLQLAISALIELDSVDIKDKFGVIIYDGERLPVVLEAIAKQQHITCLVSYGTPCDLECPVPLLSHIPNTALVPATNNHQSYTRYTYPTSGRFFVLPQCEDYHAGSAGVSHSRSLVFLRKHIGGPHFDLEAIWDEHTYFEFEIRSVAKTMGTMMTGGIGRDNLTAFYRDHFIFSNPADTSIEPVSRTVGADRIIDEFIFSLTHDRIVDWLLPGVAPTGKKLSIPMMSVVNVRGDRLYHEHIWWDQAGALKQVGILPSHLPHPLTGESTRLPITGIEAARLLVDETDGESNEMLEESWGVNQ